MYILYRYIITQLYLANTTLVSREKKKMKNFEHRKKST
jgi:hypothetical protein